MYILRYKVSNLVNKKVEQMNINNVIDYIKELGFYCYL